MYGRPHGAVERLSFDLDHAAFMNGVWIMHENVVLFIIRRDLIPIRLAAEPEFTRDGIMCNYIDIVDHADAHTRRIDDQTGRCLIDRSELYHMIIALVNTAILSIVALWVNVND